MNSSYISDDKNVPNKIYPNNPDQPNITIGDIEIARKQMNKIGTNLPPITFQIITC